MPLEDHQRNLIDAYCKRDLPGDIDWHISQFHFIDNLELRNRLGRAFYSGRYIGKLMEALSPMDGDMHPFVKFQIMQYASIYEAVIVHLLWRKFENHSEVLALQTHKAYKPIRAFASPTNMTYDGLEVHACLYKDAKTPRNSIPFRDKVDCAVRIGFVDPAYSEDIKETYALRNLAHIETEASRQIEVELEHARTSYWRMKPFLETISNFLREAAPS